MLKSFIETDTDSHFPIQNLPYSAFKAQNGDTHLCSAIGDYIVDLYVLDEAGCFDGPKLRNKKAFCHATLNYFMSLGKECWDEARHTLQQLLAKDNPRLRDDDSLRVKVLIPMKDAQLVMPVSIGDYTDFYSSEQHAFNVGKMFRGAENALMPNWKHLPVGYHGRASSVVLSGAEIHRPAGQVLPPDSDKPVFSASRLVDFELEMGFFTGPGNELGKRISVDDAEQHIFGLALVNDWSARDIQKWEYQPLGPFLAKSWATSISPWIVPLQALEPFRIPCNKQEPAPLSYLQQKNRSTFDIQLEVYLDNSQLDKPFRLCTSNFKHLYWTMAQQLAHHTINGCNIRPGDLYASGTISGPEENSFGSLLELTWRGSKPIQLPNGEQRTFIEDGDEIIMTGFAQGEGYRIGFGEVKGKILPTIQAF